MVTGPRSPSLAWDVGHNPFGRAHLLADLLRDRFDVELWGAQFERYGSDVWLPMRDTDIPVRRYAGAEFPEFFETMEDAARRIDADAIYVSKPRFPGLGVGILAKELWNRPLVLDVDDFEPSFFTELDGTRSAGAPRRRDDPDLKLPFGRLWTRACEFALSGVDQITVSNRELEERYGGVIVPHARDESLFDPARVDRAATRRRLGLRDDDRLILFGGTPRAHKGIVELLASGRSAGRSTHQGRRVRDAESWTIVRKQVGSLDRWIVPVALPRVQRASVGPRRGRSHCRASVARPSGVALPDAGEGDRCDGDGRSLPGDAGAAAAAADRQGRARGLRRRHHRSTNGCASSSLIRDARDRSRRRGARGVPRVLQLRKRCGPSLAGRDRTASRRSAARSRESVVTRGRGTRAVPAVDRVDRVDRAASRSRRRVARVPAGSTYDLVMFWKQNDTGIYGRRQDMFLKYLERSGRFDKIIHFDHPMSAEALVLTARAGIGTSDQNRLVVQQTLRRVAHRGDQGAVRSRTFIYSGGRFTRRLKASAAQPVRRLRTFGARTRAASASIARSSSGSTRRQRTTRRSSTHCSPTSSLPMSSTTIARGTSPVRRTSSSSTRTTRTCSSRSDVVLANCEPVAESMLEFAPEVHVIPNACELPEPGAATARPAELRGLNGPIIGYAGNLSGRIDLDLLRATGAWHAATGTSCSSVRRTSTDPRSTFESEPNVRFIGTKRYERAQAIIAHFDVALIPHLDNDMSRSMNPLKAYVYCALGVPIVSSPVANLEQLSDFITIANDTNEFIAAIEASLRAGKVTPDRDSLYPHSWNIRVERTLELVDDGRAPPLRTVAVSASERRFFFVHLQKTAGTALFQRLRDHFGAEAVYPRPDDQTDIRSTTDVDFLLDRYRKHGDTIRVVTGHFPLCAVELFDAPFTTFTVLREPGRADAVVAAPSPEGGRTLPWLDARGDLPRSVDAGHHPQPHGEDAVADTRTR